MLLLLLGVDAEVPLKKILLMKEAFLFEKELSYDLDLNFDSLKFVPYKYGSYSMLLDLLRQGILIGKMLVFLKSVNLFMMGSLCVTVLFVGGRTSMT